MIIKNGIVFSYPEIDGERLSIKIDRGVVKKIGQNILPEEGEKVIDAKNMYVIPGLVDLHAHFRTPGFEYKEDFITGSNAAAKGGITTAVAMPNTKPTIDNPSIIRELKEEIKNKSKIEILISSAMTKDRNAKDIVNIKENKKAGAIFFTDDGSDINDPVVIFNLTKEAYKNKALLFVHPEIHSLTENKPFNKGELNSFFGMEGQPSEAESLSILIFGLIAGMNNTNVHFTHISTKKSVEAIRFLKERFGSKISCDATPHHLILNDKDLINSALDMNKKINPPLRSEEDRVAIEKALLGGTIDVIATDHAPHSKEEKSLSIDKALPGSIGFETFLPSTFTHLVKSNKMSVINWIKLITYFPSRIINIDRGEIKKGKKANIVIFNPDEKIKIDENFFLSKSKNSAFMGKEFYGKVYHTIARGEIVFYEKD